MTDKPRWVQVPLPPDVYAEAKRLAEADDRSMRRFLAQLIRREVERLAADE